MPNCWLPEAFCYGLPIFPALEGDAPLEQTHCTALSYTTAHTCHTPWDGLDQPWTWSTGLSCSSWSISSPTSDRVETQCLPTWTAPSLGAGPSPSPAVSYSEAQCGLQWIGPTYREPPATGRISGPFFQVHRQTKPLWKQSPGQTKLNKPRKAGRPWGKAAVRTESRKHCLESLIFLPLPQRSDSKSCKSL